MAGKPRDPFLLLAEEITSEAEETLLRVVRASPLSCTEVAWIVVRMTQGDAMLIGLEEWAERGRELATLRRRREDEATRRAREDAESEGRRLRLPRRRGRRVT